MISKVCITTLKALSDLKRDFMFMRLFTIRLLKTFWLANRILISFVDIDILLTACIRTCQISPVDFQHEFDSTQSTILIGIIWHLGLVWHVVDRTVKQIRFQKFCFESKTLQETCGILQYFVFDENGSTYVTPITNPKIKI
jgi:hypothetical protein